MKEIVIGRVRNEETAHGPTREATQAEAEAAVTAIANGINYLARLDTWYVQASNAGPRGVTAHAYIICG